MCWHWPIFPGRRQPSIVGSSELNCRVRNGYGWTLTANNTNYFGFLLSCQHRPIFPGRRQPSIFGSDELNCRVRNGYGWTLIANDTDYISTFCADIFLYGAPSGIWPRDASRSHMIKMAVALATDLFLILVAFGAPSGIRTRDPLIKSQLLYQLS